MFISRNDDTICAPATIPGTGAISVIRVSGHQALTIADKIVECKRGKICEAEGYSIRFGTIFNESGDILDQVLVSIFKAPHSYTGENSVEISCHSSAYIVSQIINLLLKAGARSAEPGEFTQRAFINGKMDLAQAEAVADVIASQNAAAHRIAMRQLKGGFSSELKKMRSSLLEIVSLMELELDFSEEEVEFADRGRLKELVDATLDHIARLVGSFKAGNAIKNGVPVAIAGATNAGKSTLLNSLLGEERAIVSDIHGTTRDTIEETLVLDGVLFRFIDTAGLRETEETIEKIGIQRTLQKIDDASVVLAMIDSTRPFEEISSNLIEIVERVHLPEQKLMILLNKADLTGLDEVNHAENNFISVRNLIVSCIENKGINVNESFLSGYDAGFADSATTIPIIPISAREGTGLDTLRTTLSASVKDLLKEDGTMVTNTRHIQALTQAQTSLTRVREGLDTTLPTDLLAQDLRETLHHLGTITGDITTDEVLGNIFRNFC
ncbi:MAG: tRNA uridine-5-carboxymethylaminomethyl(34) synthesis GTPase MnmE, partial [Candidatus Cryptobacteroides sp.]